MAIPQTMKRCAIVLLLLLFSAGALHATLLLQENFSYSTGRLANVGGGNWVYISGDTLRPVQVVSGSQSYTGYQSSGIANQATISAPGSGGGEDYYRSFTSQAIGATVYASFLLNVTDTIGLAPNTNEAGENFASLMDASTVLISRISIRKGASGATFNLGIRAASPNTNAAWDGADLNTGTTYLVVVRYQMIAGSNNDVAAIFINPSLSGAEPQPDTNQVTTLSGEPNSISRFVIRQNYSSVGPTATPNASIDGIRVGTTWDDIKGTVSPNPVVSSTSPLNNAVNVPVNAAITVTFDRPINYTTVDTASFKVAGVKQARYYPDSIRPVGNSASFTFYVQDSLLRRDTVTVTLSTAIADTGGNNLAAIYTWTFYTYVPPVPVVVSTSPVNNAANVATNAAISVNFSRMMNAATIDTASFAVAGVKQARYYPDSIRPVGNSASFTFYVKDSLRRSDTVTVTLANTIADTGGNTLAAPYNWQFYTVLPDTINPTLVSSNPANGASRVSVDANIVLTFSESLHPATADTSAIELLGKKRAKYPIATPVLSVGNTVLTVSSSIPLVYADTVTVHIKPALTDISGNGIRDTSITFNTRVSPDLTIYDIQYTTEPSGNSPYAGQIVTITGVVTAVVTGGYSNSTYFLQDGPGPWNGVYIYAFDDAAQVGDSVSITGSVSEYPGAGGVTEISSTSSYNVLKTGCVLPAPVPVTTGMVSASWEPYEGVLVTTTVPARVNTVTPTPNDGYIINDGSGPCEVGNFISPYATVGYSPVVGDSLLKVQGIAHYGRFTSASSSFGIEPRKVGDVVDNKPIKITGTTPANGSINVPTAVLPTIRFSKPAKIDSMIPGRFKITENNGTAVSFSLEYDSTAWSCRLIPSRELALNESVAVWVSHSIMDTLGNTLDGNGNGLSVNDSTDDYTFKFVTISGVMPIGEVQRTGSDGYGSLHVGETVLLQGVLTGPAQYFSSSTWSNSAGMYIQDNTGGANIFTGGVTMGDPRIGPQSALGQLCVVSGKVTEYSGVTEITTDITTMWFWGKAGKLPGIDTLIYNQFLTEDLEGKLVMVSGTISSPPSYAGGGYNMEIRNGDAPIAIRISEASRFPLQTFNNGVKVQIIGVASQYDKYAPFDAGYQLVPRFADPYTYNGINYPADIVIITDTVTALATAQIAGCTPNPFCPDWGEAQQIDLNGPVTDRLTLRVYDLKGRLVKTLLNNVPGGHQVCRWDGTNDQHRRANIGMYILHLRSVSADGAITNKSLVVVLGTRLK